LVFGFFVLFLSFTTAGALGVFAFTRDGVLFFLLTFYATPGFWFLGCLHLYGVLRNAGVLLVFGRTPTAHVERRVP